MESITMFKQSAGKQEKKKREEIRNVKQNLKIMNYICTSKPSISIIILSVSNFKISNKAEFSTPEITSDAFTITRKIQ